MVLHSACKVSKTLSLGDLDDIASRALEIGPEPAVAHLAGRQVPLNASQDPACEIFKTEFNEEYYIVPANDGDSILLFPCTLESETSDGKIGYREKRPDDDDPRLRVELANRIYQHLQSRGPLHPRLVNYLGITSTGFRLERMRPGQLTLNIGSPSVNLDQYDAVLALNQRWALQMLSALRYLHHNNVYLNNVGQNVFLRADYSIAVANMTAAGSSCTEPPVEGCPRQCGVLASPWTPDSCQTPGNICNDLFDWASWAFDILSGGTDPVLLHMGKEGPAEYRTDEWERYLDNHRRIEQGLFNDWPELDANKLGPVIVKAWKGQYDSADQAFEEVKSALQASGRKMSVDKEDEIDGYDWQQIFEVTTCDRRGRKLCLRSWGSEKT